MRRREFIVGLSATAAIKAPSGSIAGIHVALKQAGLEVGQSVRMEYRYANNQFDRLPVLAAELVKIPVDVLISSGGEGNNDNDSDRIRAGA